MGLTRRACRVLVGPHDGGVDPDLPSDPFGGVGQGLQPGEDLLPDTGPLPAAKQGVHRLPGAVALRHVPPGLRNTLMLNGQVTVGFEMAVQFSRL